VTTPDELDDTILVRRRADRGQGAAEPDDDTVLVDRRASPVSAPDDDTVVRPRPAPVAAPDDDTVVRPRSAPAVAPTLQRTGSAPPAPRPPAAPSPRVHGLRVGAAVHRLDAPVVVGRRPSAPRVASGPPAVLVPVASPTSEVSSSHVRVEQLGATVVVTDLRSTNGTVVTLPGRVPVTLRQGESSVALAGTIVDVGDGNLLEILPPPRSVAQEEPRP
jgi:pSer/pThr/pTyr-binding forkhead associated (FHA) protein